MQAAMHKQQRWCEETQGKSDHLQAKQKGLKQILLSEKNPNPTHFLILDF